MCLRRYLPWDKAYLIRVYRGEDPGTVAIRPQACAPRRKRELCKACTLLAGRSTSCGHESRSRNQNKGGDSGSPTPAWGSDLLNNFLKKHHIRVFSPPGIGKRPVDTLKLPYKHPDFTVHRHSEATIKGYQDLYLEWSTQWTKNSYNVCGLLWRKQWIIKPEARLPKGNLQCDWQNRAYACKIQQTMKEEYPLPGTRSKYIKIKGQNLMSYFPR